MIAHNLMIAGLVLGWSGRCLVCAGLAVWFAASMLGGMIGVFLVYLQHNFEDTYWDRKPDLDFRKATLQGSSSLDLGWWWDLGTGNIAYHDLHHYNPAIPSYNLRRCQHDLPQHLQSHDADSLARGAAQPLAQALGRRRRAAGPVPARGTKPRGGDGVGRWKVR
ncbi:MAG: fatty acid desaturase [Roseovarius sp.]|nr:fatty acid desaturase [Roseovarius sp.]